MENRVKHGQVQFKGARDVDFSVENFFPEQTGWKLPELVFIIKEILNSVECQKKLAFLANLCSFDGKSSETRPKSKSRGPGKLPSASRFFSGTSLLVADLHRFSLSLVLTLDPNSLGPWFRPFFFF